MLEYLSLSQAFTAEGLDITPYGHLCTQVGIAMITCL